MKTTFLTFPSRRTHICTHELVQSEFTQAPAWETEQGEKTRRKWNGLRESEKQFGLCQIWHLAFCWSDGDCVDSVVRDRVLSERETPLRSYCETSEYQSSVCLFHCVRVFITCGFKMLSLYTHTSTHWRVLAKKSRGELNIGLFSKHKTNESNKSL